MNTESEFTLSDDTVANLQTLVQLGIDSRDGLNEAAGKKQTPYL